MNIGEILNLQAVACRETAGSKKRVLEKVSKLLAAAEGLNEIDIFDKLLERERLGSTAIGHGVAIPHGRCGAFTEARAAFLRVSPAVDFGAGDGEPVDLVFAMAVPSHFPQQHLELLSELAEHFADPAFRAALRQAADAEALAAALQAGRAP